MDKKPVGFIGLGVMGHALAGHLLKAGHPLFVYTRREEKARDLVSSGAVWKSSPALLATECDVVFTMVGYPTDVEEVYFGDKGLIGAARPGSILVDLTTSSPELAMRIHAAAATRGVAALDAPVSGGDIGARNATLTIMAGGDEGAFEAAKPVLELFGPTVIRQGGPGAGQHTKMTNQISVAGCLISAMESMIYARAAGLDPLRVLQSIGKGAASSWQLNNTAPRMLSGDFNPGFFVKHFLKDLKIALDSARAMKIHLPFLELAENLYAKAVAEGLGDLGTQALFNLYERGLV